MSRKGLVVVAGFARINCLLEGAQPVQPLQASRGVVWIVGGGGSRVRVRPFRGGEFLARLEPAMRPQQRGEQGGVTALPFGLAAA